MAENGLYSLVSISMSTSVMPLWASLNSVVYQLSDLSLRRLRGEIIKIGSKNWSNGLLPPKEHRRCNNFTEKGICRLYICTTVSVIISI
jgi:hypothetical protein